VDINATLIGEMITFALFVWFTMRFIWPLLEKVLKEREEKVAAGLAAAERGHKELEIAQKYAIQHIHEARSKAVEAIELAKKQATLIVEQAKAEAARERAQIVALGEATVAQERRQAKDALQAELIGITIASTEKLLSRVMTDKDKEVLLNDDFKELKTWQQEG